MKMRMGRHHVKVVTGVMHKLGIKCGAWACRELRYAIDWRYVDCARCLKKKP